jgi:hypothetical protein
MVNVVWGACGVETGVSGAALGLTPGAWSTRAARGLMILGCCGMGGTKVTVAVE